MKEAIKKLFNIRQPRTKQYDVCRIKPAGVELLLGAGYDDQDLRELFVTTEPDAQLVAQPLHQGLLAELPRGDHEPLVLSLDEALRDARKFYAGGFTERIPA